MLLFAVRAYSADPGAKNDTYLNARKSLRKHDYEKASPLLAKARKQEPQSIIILSASGYCAAKLGKNEEAMEHYGKILQLAKGMDDPDKKTAERIQRVKNALKELEKKEKAKEKEEKKVHTYSFTGSQMTLAGKTSSGTTRSVKVTPKFKCQIPCFKGNGKACKGNCFDARRLKKDVQSTLENNLKAGKGLSLTFHVKVYSAEGGESSSASIDLENGMEMVMKLAK